MSISIIAVGRMKEKPYRAMADEYLKRLSRYGKFEEIELPDLPEPANSSPAIEAQIREKEGEAILAKIREGDIVVALCIDGKQMDSVQLSQKLTSLIDTGRRVVFVIGGSLGLSQRVVSRAQIASGARMTPGELARLGLAALLLLAAVICCLLMPEVKP